MICRLCLNKPEEVLELFGENGEIVEREAIDIIQRHFQVQILFNDDVSNKICFLCWRYLNEFHKFWLNIKEKQQTLHLFGGKVLLQTQQQQQQNDFDYTRIKSEELATEPNAYGQINSTFDDKNILMCESELNIDDIKAEPNLALEFDDAMNGGPPFQESDALEKINETQNYIGATLEEVKRIVRQETQMIIETMREENRALKDTLQKNNNILRGEMQILSQAIAEQKAIFKNGPDVPNLFPIKSMEELKCMDAEINEDNRDIYIKTMRNLLQPGGVLKQLKFILSDEVIMSSNIDGVHGKTALKTFERFYKALIESIPVTEMSGPADMQLRRAMQLQKKRFFNRNKD